MPTNIWLGNSIGNNKSVQITPGLNVTNLAVPFSIGLPNALFSYTGWDQSRIISDWNTSTNPAVQEITATASADSSSVIFTAIAAGRDFEITCTLPNGAAFSSSTYQTLSLLPAPSGGTFTLTIGSLTTGAITYSSNPVTFAASMATAIAALSGFGVTDVLVTPLAAPESFLFDFSHGQFIGLNVPVMTATHTSLTGGDATVTVTVNAVGSASSAGTSEIATLTFPANGTHTALVNAVQTLASTAKAGSFTISIGTYGTTVRLPYTAGRSLIRQALETLVGRGNVQVTGGPLYYPPTAAFATVTCTFVGALAGIAVATMTIATYDLATNEIQQIKMTGIPTAGTFTLTYSGQTTSALAYTVDAATVQAAMIALSNIGPTDIVCSGGPLFPGGSPVTADVAVNQFIRVLSNGGSIPLSSSNYNADDNPGGNSAIWSITDYHAGGQQSEFLVAIPVHGYPSQALFRVCLYAPTTVKPLIDIAAIDNAAVYFMHTYAEYAAAGFSGGVGSPTETTVTDNNGNTQYIETYDITSIVQTVVSRPGWVNGNSIFLRIYTTDPVNQNIAIIGLNTFGGVQGAYDFLHLDGSGVPKLVTPKVSYIPTLNTTIVSGVYGPITLQFQGALGGANLTQTTVTDSVTGGDVVASTISDGVAGGYTPTATVSGGSATVNNIVGGTFSLNIGGTIVNNLAYNITATNLALAINTAFGSTVCTVSGGPAPGSTLTITFENALANQPITLTFLNAIQTTLASSVTQTVPAVGAVPVVAANVWELDVCPGRGTLGISATAQIVLVVTNTLSNVVSNTTLAPIGQAILNLSTLAPHLIQAAVNEILGGDACRVTQIGHSQEFTNIEIPATGGQAAEFMGIWYMKDRYQIIFVNQWSGSGSTSVSAHFLPALNVPSLFMSYTAGTTNLSSTSDPIDQFPEINRVVLGFVAMQATATPLHVCSTTLAVDTPTSNNMSWRYKLLTQYVGDSLLYTGVAEPDSGSVQFAWGKQTINSLGAIVFTPVAVSAVVDWNSPASTFQTILGNMFFGQAGISVSGGLRGSWLSESLLDAPITIPYQDLQVALTGNFNNLPLDEYGYTLQLSIVTPQFATSTSFQKNFAVYGDFLTHTLPPHYNHRESIQIDGISNVATISIGTCAGTTVVSPDITAVQLQAALDALFPFFASTAGMVPDKLRHPIVVYGTSFADGPMKFEFSSGGLQQSSTPAMVVHTTIAGLVVGLITITTPGVSAVAAVDANQLVSILGSPFSGTFTLTFGGHTTSALAYNIALSALQAAVTTADFSSPTITGSASTGFTFVWAGAGGARAAITAAAALVNAGHSTTITVTQNGGVGGSFTFTELVRGRGPFYGDDFNNWSLGHVPTTGENLIFDDSPSPMVYGLDMSSIILPQQIATGVISIFAHTKNRQVFDNGQQIVLTGAGTAPAGMTFGNTYTVAIASGNLFSLQDSSGNYVRATTPGVGTLTLAVSNLTLSVYSRFGGGQIGLARVRSSQTVLEYLAQFWRAGFTSITIGLDEGNGLTLGYFDAMSAAAIINVIANAPSQNSPIPTILLITNNAAAALHVKNGDVGLALYSNQVTVIGAVTLDEGSLSIANSTVGSLATLAGSTLSVLNSTITGNVTVGLP